MKEYTLEAFAQDVGQRIDVFIMAFAKANDIGLSRTHIQKLMLDGDITLNGKGSAKPHHKIKIGDRIYISIKEKRQGTLGAQELPLDIVYEDEDLAVIDKHAGMVVHPGAGNSEHTMANALLYRFKDLSDVNPQRPGIVHRLDKDTSGLMLVAKNNFTHLKLAEKFAEHSIKRQYIALVKGRVEFDEDIIEIPIGRHPLKRKNMAAGFTEHSKYAKTYYRTVRRTDAFSVLELTPFTGRTHQLRVHLAFLGHPILGDTKYGQNNQFVRLALHAKYIGFTHPRSGKFMDFESEMPVEFRKFIESQEKPPGKNK